MQCFEGCGNRLISQEFIGRDMAQARQSGGRDGRRRQCDGNVAHVHTPFGQFEGSAAGDDAALSATELGHLLGVNDLDHTAHERSVRTAVVLVPTWTIRNRDDRRRGAVTLRRWDRLVPGTNLWVSNSEFGR